MERMGKPWNTLMVLGPVMWGMFEMLCFACTLYDHALTIALTMSLLVAGT